MDKLGFSVKIVPEKGCITPKFPRLKQLDGFRWSLHEDTGQRGKQNNAVDYGEELTFEGAIAAATKSAREIRAYRARVV